MISINYGALLGFCNGAWRLSPFFVWQPWGAKQGGRVLLYRDAILSSRSSSSATQFQQGNGAGLFHLEIICTKITHPMPSDATRRSSRPVKVKKDSIYEYDHEVLEALTGASKLISTADSETAIVQSASVESVTGENEFEIVHLGSNSSEPIERTVEKVVVNSNLSVDVSQSQSSVQSEHSVFSNTFVNSASADRRKSSTRLDFLGSPFMDLAGNFLSANSINSMSDSEVDNVSVVLEEGKASSSGATGLTSESEKLIEAIVTAFDTRFSAMEATLVNTNERLDKIEERDNIASASESEKKGKSSKKCKKIDRVEFERDRSLKVLLEKLLNRTKGKVTETEDDDTEEEVFDLKRMKNSMSKKKKEESRLRAAQRLQQAGGSFPVNESDSSSSAGSGNESDARTRKSRKKVKSGARVKQRSVIKTELWPHTIANEEDGEDHTSENIGLAKFLSCFTYIMVTCDGKEATGRPVLLHALTSMLEDLPWTEVRTFHNLIMVKLEQGRIDWGADFTDLSDQHFEKKVRKLLRAKAAQPANTPAGSRAGYRNYGGGASGFGSSYNRSYDIRSKVVYSTVCKQWNEGSCTYGARCKRWHVCWACGEAGKLGEPHKSTSSGCPNSRRGGNHQRNY